MHEMPSHQQSVIKCEDCAETISNNRWSKTKSDWFFQKDGKAYCGRHIPDWVHEWRLRKGNV